MSFIIGIDIGGSTTKIVGLKDNRLVSPFTVRAGDPLTSVYGAFGKFLTQNSLKISDVSSIICTGVGSSLIKEPIYGIETLKADEFIAIGLGGKFISGFDNAVVVSMGTGTAFVSVNGDDISHVGGSGIGGGTIIGLCEKLFGVREFSILETLAGKGDLSNIDLTIGDITDTQLSNMNNEITASNFGKVSDVATPEDLAAGVFNLVLQSAGVLACFAARMQNTDKIILTGQLSSLNFSTDAYRKLEGLYGCKFIIPEFSDFATAIGAAIYGQKKEQKA